ncbi:2-methylcitrate dehydratase [Ectobacillus sp. JY-23]|uniref:2-methylcitrate dehydratase n=1 Tax=Ectobacillus sp. JY-23 TaxID=2933872 RepID=UPI001FF1E1FD|nr:2-methylcitrate dehydratase [Ectobacillus sp. JY-23]UOY92883.1 2-methylcitrate dehydratase [Ectobacillus sp. JY-23]
MSYIEFKPVLKKVNLKPDGKQEIVLEVTNGTLNGKLDALSEMIDCKVEVSLESLEVNYSITINARTNKPMREYTVDDKGVVQELKPSHEQLEAELDVAEAKVPTKEEKQEADREIIDAFIISGMAPSYDDLPNDFANIVKRKLEGESYNKLANELGISSSEIVTFVGEYRQRVAPLAVKWNEWKEQQDEDADK